MLGKGDISVLQTSIFIFFYFHVATFISVEIFCLLATLVGYIVVPWPFDF